MSRRRGRSREADPAHEVVAPDEAEPHPDSQAQGVPIEPDPAAGHRELELHDPGPEAVESDLDDPVDSRIEPNEVALAADPSLWVPPHRSHRIAVGLSLLGLATAAFVTGLILFNNLVMPRFIHRAGEVKVPDLANLTFEQAERQAAPLGLQLSRAGERFDPTVPSGFILSQDPPEGTPVRGRHRVMVVVSLGEEFSSVPELFGESVRGTRLLLERAGLRVGGITHAPSDEVGQGLVVDTDPPAESVLPRGTPVALLVSTGSGPEEFVMPDLLGRQISGVRRQLESLGFRVFTPPASPSSGTIMFQDPPPGSRITRDANIMLQVTGRMIR